MGDTPPASTESPEVVRMRLESALRGWDDLTVAARADNAKMLVEWAGVLVGDGLFHTECLVVVKWKRRENPDIPVGW